MSTIKNVFISHYSGDDEHIQKLKDLLDTSNYSLKNSSIDSTKPNSANNDDYIKQILRERISWAGTVICLIGPKTHTREWVNWEIDQAFKQGKRIVGIYINGGSESDIPENLELYGDAVVCWTSKNIIGALEGEINNWETPEGKERTPHYYSSRSRC